METHEKNQVSSAIIVAGLLIAGAILLKGHLPVGNVGVNGEPTDYSALKIRAVSKDEHILGNPNAKVVVVEYSDTECPFCKAFHTTMHTVISERGEKVAWVYRHYPIAQLHPKAFHEAEALECAWEQGGNNTFWKYTDEVYTRTLSNNKLEVSELPKIAEFVGLNMNQFNTCLASGKYKTKIESDITNGTQIGVSGTPTSFILKNGKIVNMIPGAQPLLKVNQMLDAALK